MPFTKLKGARPLRRGLEGPCGIYQFPGLRPVWH